MVTGHLFGQSVQNNGKPSRILHVFSGVQAGRHADHAAHVASVTAIATSLLRNRLTYTMQMQPTLSVGSVYSDQPGTEQPGTGRGYQFDLTASNSVSNLGSAARWNIKREGKPAAAKPTSRSHTPERNRERGRG